MRRSRTTVLLPLLFAVFHARASLAQTNPQIPQGQSAIVPTVQGGGQLSGLNWMIRIGSTVVATSAVPNGWWAASSFGTTAVRVHATAAIDTYNIVIWSFYIPQPARLHYGYFDVIPGAAIADIPPPAWAEDIVPMDSAGAGLSGPSSARCT